MTQTERKLADPGSRTHFHGDLQRKVLIWFLIGVAILALILVPVIVSEELRLDIARQLNLAPHHDGELIVDGNSGASLVVLPVATQLEGNDRTVYRHLAAYVAYAENGELRFDALNGDGELTVPFDQFDLISTSPDASQMFVSGPEGAALIDVNTTSLIETFEPGSEPNVDWDWETPVWALGIGRCDMISMEKEWIACFPGELAVHLAGDWQLRLLEFGNPDNEHDVVRGLGFRPTVGFTANDEWMYVANEYGIRRYDVEAVTSG